VQTYGFRFLVGPKPSPEATTRAIITGFRNLCNCFGYITVVGKLKITAGTAPSDFQPLQIQFCWFNYVNCSKTFLQTIIG